MIILTRKYKDLRAEGIKLPAGRVGGEFKYILRNSMGGIVQESDWIPNIVTNTGLIDFYRTSGAWNANFHAGSSATAASVSDSTLGGWLGFSGTSQGSAIEVVAGAPNYQWSHTIGKRFIAGVATGTIREVGIGRTTTNDNMSIRAVLSPEVVKATDQVLDLYYKMTIWPSITDVLGVTSIAGDDYNYIVRSGSLGISGLFVFTNFGMHTQSQVYTEDIGSLTGVPAGGISNSTSGHAVAGASGSGYVTYENYFYDLNNVNVGGIRSFRLTPFNAFNKSIYQIQFNRVSDDAKILKDNTKTLSLDFTHTWSR